MNLISDIEKFQKRLKVKARAEKKDPVVIRCRKCYEQIYLCDLSKEGPVRGKFFTSRPGCEHWGVPSPHDRGMDLICPHAVMGDLHLFVHVDDRGEAWDVMLDDCSIYRFTTTDCECGCGDLVKKGKEFAHGLECYNRLRARKAQERENG